MNPFRGQPPLRVKATADGGKIEVRRYFPFRPKGKQYEPSVLDQLHAAKTADEVHRIVSDHLADHASERARRHGRLAAEARLAQLRADALTGAA